jgi:NTE family protein
MELNRFPCVKSPGRRANHSPTLGVTAQSPSGHTSLPAFPEGNRLRRFQSVGPGQEIASVLQYLRRGTGGDEAVDVNESTPAPDRPIIGLALGGGAARGFAHIGVIRTLLSKGLVPDVITGTSIGAVVGGCYAAGRLDGLEKWGLALTRRRVLGYLDVSFTGSGLINGSRLTDQLAAEVGEIMIEALPHRFAAIATEIGTGHEIWLTRGRLVDALRASYALPGIFSPVDIGGRWLMDGALVNPVPVSAARALGARLVIAVNLNADLFGRGTTIHDHGPEREMVTETVKAAIAEGKVNAAKAAKRQLLGKPGRPGLTTVMMDAFNVMQDRITRARLAGDPPDVMVNPRLAPIGLFDFHRAADAIALGAEATERAIEPLAEALTALA